MKPAGNALTFRRVEQLLAGVRRSRILVVGDVMLDQFVWGRVSRISPEAPVPVVEFDHENCVPGGAANVAQNLTALGAQTEMFTVLGDDASGRQLRELLEHNQVRCCGCLARPERHTAIKTRIIAHQQQIVRLDRETREELDGAATDALLTALDQRLDGADAVIVGDYGKGVVTQPLLEALKARCRPRGIWLSLDPKPIHQLDLHGLSLITPNRKEAFELAGVPDGMRRGLPETDPELQRVVETLLQTIRPAVLLITLGEQGMLLCQHNPAGGRRNKKAGLRLHIPTVAQEVFDVSGAGDTVIASFTLAVAAGASPAEAAIFSNHAAGVVVGKVGTAVVEPAELLKSFRRAG